MGHPHQKRYHGGNVNHDDHHYGGEIDPLVVHVSNLTKDIDAEMISKELSKFGPVEKVMTRQSKTWTYTGNQIWYAFVTFLAPEGAAAAVEAGRIVINGVESILRPRKSRPFYHEDNQHRSDNYYYNQRGKDSYGSFKNYQPRNDREAFSTKEVTSVQPPPPKNPEGPKAAGGKKQKANAGKPSDGKADKEGDKEGDEKESSKSSFKVKIEQTTTIGGPLNPQNATYFEPGAICEAPVHQDVERQTKSASPFLEPQSQIQVEGIHNLEVTPSDFGEARFSMVVKYIPPYYDRAYFDRQCISLCKYTPKSMQMFTDGVTRLAIITGETHEQAKEIFKSLNALRVDPSHTLRLVWLSEQRSLEDILSGSHGVEKPKRMPSYFVPHHAASSPNLGVSARNDSDDNNRLGGSNDSPVASDVSFKGFERNSTSMAHPYLSPAIGIHSQAAPYNRFENTVQQYHPQPFAPSTSFLSPQILPLQRTVSISTTGRGASPPTNFSQTKGNNYPSFDNHFTAPNSRLPSPSMMAPPLRQPLFDGPFRYPPSFAPHPTQWPGAPNAGPPILPPHMPPSHMPPSHMPPQFMGPMGIVDRSPQFFDNQGVPGMMHGQGIPHPQYGHPMLGVPPNPIFNPQVTQEMSTEFSVPFAPSNHNQNETLMQNPTQDMSETEIVASLPPTSQNQIQDPVQTCLQHIPDSKDPDDLTLLFVKNLDDDLVSNDKELRDLFAPYGEIESVELRLYENGRSKSFGFVKFVNAEDAKKVKDTLHEQIKGKKRMFISYAEPKEQREKRLNAIFKGNPLSSNQETTESEESSQKSNISQDDTIQRAPRRSPSPDISDNGKTYASALASRTSQVAKSASQLENKKEESMKQDKFEKDNSGKSEDTAKMEEPPSATESESMHTLPGIDTSGRGVDTLIKHEAVALMEDNTLISPERPIEHQNFPSSHGVEYEQNREAKGRSDSHTKMIEHNTSGPVMNNELNNPRMMEAPSGPDFFRPEPVQGHPHLNSPPWKGHRNQAHHVHPNAMGNTSFYPNGHQYHSNNYRGRNNWFTNKNTFGRGNGNAPQFRPSRFPRETQPPQAHHVPHTFHDTSPSEKANTGYMNNGMMPKNQSGSAKRNENQTSFKREFQQPKYNDDFAHFNNGGQARNPLSEGYHGQQPTPPNRHPSKKKRGGNHKDFPGSYSHQTPNPKTDTPATWLT